jgi:alkanesulfonate monooxygenase SsuD/methylene tetrahydromethanopterin reductase-like flavin-dependent oxidoreductase (luciferase family)
MKIGMSIPSTVAEGNRDTLCEWIRRIDAGPFSRLATGERIASPFLDLMGVLSAAAVLTERVPIQALIALAPLHEPVLLAKQAATVDVLSNGRFTLGVGVGMRDYDYALAGKAEVFAKRLSELDARVEALRAVWSGNYPLPPDSPPLGPTPVQAGGPPIFSSSLGPKSMRRAARWADGLAGFHMGPDLKEIEAIFDAFRRAWSGAERSGTPTLQMAFWFGLVDSAPERVVAFAADYLSIFGPEFARARSQLCNATSPAAIRDILRKLEDLGCDEAIMTPTTANIDELSAAEDLVASL